MLFCKHCWNNTFKTSLYIQFLCRFIMNESALCYRLISVYMHVCLYVTKCIVTTLQMLQTYRLAQIYLLTIEIFLPNKVEKFRQFGRHLEFLKTNIWKCYNVWTDWDIDSRPPLFCSGLNYLELWLHWNLASPHFPTHKTPTHPLKVGG
jgi:hypothetical protein